MTDTKQPKALLLANILEHQIPNIACLEVSAAELRRLHEVNAELLEALKDLLDKVSIDDWNEKVYYQAQAAIANAEDTK